MDSLLLLIRPRTRLSQPFAGPDSLLTLRNTLIKGAVSGYATLAGILTGVVDTYRLGNRRSFAGRQPTPLISFA